MTTTTQRKRSRRLWALSARQHGVVTRRQLLAAGLTSNAIVHRVRTGRLHPLGHGVYAVGRPQISREGRWMAALLACGAGAVLSHATAAALWRLRQPAAVEPIHVTVGPGGVRPRPGVRTHRGAALGDDVVIRDGIRVFTPARTLLQRAATIPRLRLEREINVADALGLITPDALRREAGGFAGRAGVPDLRAVLDRHTFTLTDSELEQMFLPLAARAGLPRPATQRRVNGFRVDFFWPDIGLVVETDGLRYHRTPAQQARDLLRDQTHKAAGLEPVRFTHWQVAREQSWVVSTLRSVASHRARRVAS